jgi:centromere/kinetochore protein ZW10
MRFVLRQIRERHAAWVKILPWSACASAIGSLVNAVASKLIADIFDLTTIGVDEAEHIATIISNVESLDSLFINPAQQNGKASGEQPSLTAQFVEKWLKMRFLNEVLQSNLSDIKYLWSQSDLSYYFTVDEVVDLIKLSFENNHNVRQAIREIQSDPVPKGLITDGAS